MKKDKKAQTSWQINGAKVKWIAIITMLIDHMGAVVLDAMVSVPDFSATFPRLNRFVCLIILYSMRVIGRLAFPLFCFLITEGIRHTSNSVKYGVRLGLFAIVSEIPFDLAISGKMIEWNSQNVFFTLFIGYLVVEGLQFIDKKLEKTNALFWSFSCFIIVLGLYVAQVMRTDYGAKGVAVIVIMYLFGRRKALGTLVSLVPMIAINLLEIPALLDVLFIKKYDGTRGKQWKYFFYFFYPMHLLLLYGIRLLIL